MYYTAHVYIYIYIYMHIYTQPKKKVCMQSLTYLFHKSDNIHGRNSGITPFRRCMCAVISQVVHVFTVNVPLL